MSEYLGTRGRLVELSCPVAESVGMESRYVSDVTIEGQRRAQVLPATPRSWRVALDLERPEDIAAVSAFALGAWGPGPFEWVTAPAQIGNLLTPRESQLLDRAGISTDSVQDAGPVRDSTGAWSPRSVTVTLSSGWAAIMRGVPVHPDKPFTFSMDVQGGTSAPALHVAFYDAAGGAVGGSATTGSGTGMQRVSASYALPPAGAVEAYVGVRSDTVRATRPQVTWTPGPMPWSGGHGCRSAILDDLSEDLVLAVPGRSWSDVSFTVQEVS